MPEWRLRGEVGGSPCTFPLREGDNPIGSVRGNAVVLPVRGVSRRHARLSFCDGAAVVEDAGSRNGVLVNGARVSRATLHAGDRLRLGPVELCLEQVAADEERIRAAVPAAPDRTPGSGPLHGPGVTPTATAAQDDRSARFATVAIGALVAQQIAGKAARDALFLTSFDVRTLPFALLGGALLSAGAVLLFARAQAALSPRRVVPGAIAANAALLVLEWALSLFWRPAAAAVFYLHMALFGVTLASGFWSLVNERFDPHRAKRLVGRIGTGASAGGVIGGLFAWAASALVPVPATLLLMAGLSLLALLALRGLARGAVEAPAERGAPDLLAGFRTLGDSAHLRTLGAFVMLCAAVEVLLEFGLSVQAFGAGLRGGPLLAFFSAFQTGAGLLGLALQALLARRALEGLGLASTAALRPATVACSGLVGALVPGLGSALLARGVDVAFHHSLFRSAYELFYTPLPSVQKRSAKALIDVGCEKLGSAAGGALALALLATGTLAPRLLPASAALGAAGAVLLCRRLHTGYVRSLADSLRSGALQLAPDDVQDSTTLHVWSAAAPPGTQGEASLLHAVRGLHAADPDEVRAALRRAEPLGPTLAGHVLPLLARDDVFPEALRALRRAAPRVTGLLLDALLDPSQPLPLRLRVPRVLRGCPTQRAFDGLLLGLDEPVFELRLECGAALDRLTQRCPGLQLRAEALTAAARRELEDWPADPGQAGRRLDHLGHLLASLHDRPLLRLAFSALRSDERQRGTALEYLGNVLPAELSGAFVAALGGEPGSTSGRSSAELVTELRRRLDAPQGAHSEKG
jgi:hypothetical protein